MNNENKSKAELLHALFRVKNLSFQHVARRQHGFLAAARRGNGEDLECYTGGGALNMTEFAFLKQLIAHDKQGESGGAWLSEMRDYLCVSKAAVSQMLGSLERKGFVTRETDPEDRRTIIVKLSDDGRKAIDKVERRFDGYMLEVIEQFGEEDAREIIRLINKFADIVERLKDKEVGED